MKTLPYDVHRATLRILSDELASKEYVKKYVHDSNAWRAYFVLSKLSPYDLFCESFKILPKEITVECACRYAESVLHLFESKYPNDKRPREAIAAARNATADAAAARAAAANAARAAAANADAAAAAAADAAADCCPCRCRYRCPAAAADAAPVPLPCRCR